MRSTFTAAFLFASLLAASLLGAQTAPYAPVDHIFERWDKPTSPGCALSVMKDGHIIYKRGYGMADLDHDVPITPSSVFHVASVSKQFTAASIVLLAQEGKLSLDDDVRKYIPELPDFHTKIAIRHLIHHTSGLRDQWSLLGFAGWRYSLDLITDDDVLGLMARQKSLNFPPGDRHVYCNTGYTLLAQIVKRVGGQSLREFTTTHIFEPLGMKNTHFRDNHAEIVKNQAYGYSSIAGAAFQLSIPNFDTVGATSLLTTVEDLARWDENFYDHRVGGAALIDQLLQRGKLNSGEQLDYAFGLTLGTYKGLAIVDHGGSDAGYRADLLRFPQQHFSVACLCNTTIDPGSLARQVADLYLAKELKEPPPAAITLEKTVDLSQAHLVPRVGVYWMSDGDDTRRVTLDNGKLRIAAFGPKTELEPLGESRFRVHDSATEIRFEGTRMVATPNGGKPQFFEKGASFRPTTAQLAEYAGRYTSDEFEAVFQFQVDDGDLTIHRVRFKPITLDPAVPDVFTSSLATVRFTRDAKGKVTGAIFNAGRVQNLKMSRNVIAK
jgi:CubicO group peptidase (beta-lactamase class C family)